MHSTEVLCTVLSLFLAEARKVNGEHYPPKTLFQLMAGLLRHARSIDPNYPNFLDQSDTRFKGLQGTMDNCFRKL